MPLVSTTQLTLDFESGIGNQADSLKEYLRDYALPALWQSQGRPKKHVAADMDLSPSELTRKLSDNPNDPRNFTIDDLEDYLRTQEDMSPLYFLLDKYGPQEDDEITRLRQRLAVLESGER